MQRAVHILQNEVVFDDFFKIEKAKIQFEKFDGSMSKDVERLVLHRGDAVAVLLHDTGLKHFLLAEQFRFPTYGIGSGWLVELPAGIVESNEDVEASARREVLEETGYKVERLQRVTTVFLSPGGCSERVHIFYASISSKQKIETGGGLEEEDENIRILAVPEEKAFEGVEQGTIQDAKTVIALQWFRLNQASLRAS